MSSWEGPGMSDDWHTPAYIFDALGCRFDLDVAAPPRGPRHVPATAWLSSDALNQPCSGFVWMNPPFGTRNGLSCWLDRFFRHGNGLALMPDRTSAPWFQTAARRAGAILFVTPKIKFERSDGSLGRSPGCGTALMSAGPRGRAALFRAGGLGFVVTPNPGAEQQAAA
jgi:hypothetical protein